MKAELSLDNKKYSIDFTKGIDISIPFHQDFSQVNCFYAPYFSVDPVRMGEFIGSVKEGGPVNFTNIKLNIHGNGTHTECVGHIRSEFNSVNHIFEKPLFTCTLISIYPTQRENGDRVIERSTIEQFIEDCNSEALCIRTLPNDLTKKSRKYSGSNPVYIAEEAMRYIVEKNIKHLLVDIPSVDREEDGGKLLSHNMFWSQGRDKECTITELVFIPDEVKDNIYILFLQTASMELDAVPSKPVLYPIDL